MYVRDSNANTDVIFEVKKKKQLFFSHLDGDIMYVLMYATCAS